MVKTTNVVASDEDVGFQIKFKPWKYRPNPWKSEALEEEKKKKETEKLKKSLEDPNQKTISDRQRDEKAYEDYCKEREAANHRKFNWGACLYETFCCCCPKPAEAYVIYQRWPPEIPAPDGGAPGDEASAQQQRSWEWGEGADGMPWEWGEGAAPCDVSKCVCAGRVPGSCGGAALPQDPCVCADDAREHQQELLRQEAAKEARRKERQKKKEQEKRAMQRLIAATGNICSCPPGSDEESNQKRQTIASILESCLYEQFEPPQKREDGSPSASDADSDSPSDLRRAEESVGRVIESVGSACDCPVGEVDDETRAKRLLIEKLLKSSMRELVRGEVEAKQSQTSKKATRSKRSKGSKDSADTEGSKEGQIQCRLNTVTRCGCDKA